MTDNLPTKYNAQLAEMARAAASVEKISGGRSLSTSGGILSFDDQPLPGNRVAAIILDSVFENTFYPERYVPGAPIQSPVCYAFARREEDLAPHPSMQSDLTYFAPQGYDCTSCPWNEWGSAEIGKGKRCQQRRRLAMLPAGQYVQAANGGWDLLLYDDPAAIKGADMATLKLPVTSVKAWAKYVHELSNELQLHPMGVVTEVALVPDAKTQFRVEFTMKERLNDTMLEAVFPRREEAVEAIIQPYQAPDPEERQKGAHQIAQMRQQGGFR